MEVARVLEPRAGRELQVASSPRQDQPNLNTPRQTPCATSELHDTVTPDTALGIAPSPPPGYRGAAATHVLLLPGEVVGAGESPDPGHVPTTGGGEIPPVEPG